MVRNQANDVYFLYMEPNIMLKEPALEDLATKAVQYYCDKGIKGIAYYDDLTDDGKNGFHVGGGWRGFHAFDGHSSSSELLICNAKYITNHIAPHYVRHYRSQITGPDLEKLQIITTNYIQEMINKVPKIKDDNETEK